MYHSRQEQNFWESRIIYAAYLENDVFSILPRWYKHTQHNKERHVIRTIDRSVSCNKHRRQVIQSKCRPDLSCSRFQAWDFIAVTVEKISTSQMYGDVWTTNRISMLSLQCTRHTKSLSTCPWLHQAWLCPERILHQVKLWQVNAICQRTVNNILYYTNASW